MKHYLKGVVAAILTISTLTWAQMVFDPSQIPTIENDKLGDMVSQTIKGRITGGTGVPEDLTATQVRTLINVEDGATADQIVSDATITTSDITTNNCSTSKHGFTPKGPNTGQFLKDDCTWATPAGSGNVSTSGVPVANDFARFVDGTDIEGRSYSETRADLSLEIGTDVLAEQTIGIADNNLLEVDQTTTAVSGEIARFTANGIESRTNAEMKAQLGYLTSGDAVTSVTGGAGVSSTGGDTPSIALTVDELAEKSGALVATDRLIGTSGTTNFAETISAIPLSIFDNDLPAAATNYIDSSDGGGVYGTLTGLVNGSNTSYTVSQANYTAGKLKVWWQGQLQSGSEITETTPGSGIFTLSFAPSTGTVVMVDYD